MPLTAKQQIVKAIKDARNALILFKDLRFSSGYPAGGDAVAAALALQQILAKNNKSADIASPNFSLSPALSFLPKAGQIKNTIEAARQSAISIDIKENGIKDFSYKVEGDFLNIYLTPKEGAINFSKIKTEDGLPNYDLVIVLDTPELALLGDFYTKNKFLFDSVPVINIDHDPQNENFGEINLVDLKSSSTSELVWQILEGSKNLDSAIIDCLLAGIIAKTKNFRRPNMNPKTLEIVGQLIGLGGRQSEIVEKFYRTKSIETLKLWGRALARLKNENKIVWSLLARTDFIHTGASEDSLPDVIHELIANHYDTDVAMLIYETTNPSTSSGSNDKIKAMVYSGKNCLELKSMDIKCFPGKLVYLNLPHHNLMEAEKELLRELKK